MIGKTVRAGFLMFLAVCALLVWGAFAATAARTGGGCSTRGLAVTSVKGKSKAGSYKVVRLSTQGIACAKAQSIATQIANELLHNKSISLSGIEGIGIATTSCTGCASTTQVSVTYPNGKITVSLTGKPEGGSSEPQTPLFPTIPVPASPSPFTVPSSPAPSSPATGKSITV